MPARPDARLLLALAVSLLLHGAALGGADLLAALRQPPPRPTPAMLSAILRPAVAPPEPVLKDTLAESAAPAPARPPEQPGRGRPLAAAQRKLAEHVYYPEEAIARGLEGEVRLLLRLDAGGAVVDAEVAGSSGHAILDQAAVRAAYAMGALAGVDRRELILPVVFRLRP